MTREEGIQVEVIKEESNSKEEDTKDKDSFKESLITVTEDESILNEVEGS